MPLRPQFIDSSTSHNYHFFLLHFSHHYDDVICDVMMCVSVNRNIRADISSFPRQPDRNAFDTLQAGGTAVAKCLHALKSQLSNAIIDVLCSIRIIMVVFTISSYSTSW